MSQTTRRKGPSPQGKPPIFDPVIMYTLRAIGGVCGDIFGRTGLDPLADLCLALIGHLREHHESDQVAAVLEGALDSIRNDARAAADA